MILPIYTKKQTQNSYKAQDKRKQYSAINLSLQSPEDVFIRTTGLALAVGGFTTAIGRCATKSWLNASILGFFASTLTMFLSAPFMLKNSNNNIGVKKNSTLKPNETNLCHEILVPLRLGKNKKLIQFKQND